MNKTCIIIDNEDQTEEIEKLVRDGKQKGITIECEQFNVGSTFLDEVLTDGKIDTEKVVFEFKKRYRNRTFHLAAFDRDLNDDIDGVELIRQLSHYKLLRNTPKIIYSGLLEEVIASNMDTISRKDLLNRVKTLLNNDIKGYFERDNYDQDIIRVLSSGEETLDLIIEEQLSNYPDLVFNNSFTSDSFKGKKFSEIADLLDQDRLRNDFKREIVQQVVSYLTEKI